MKKLIIALTIGTIVLTTSPVSAAPGPALVIPHPCNDLGICLGPNKFCDTDAFVLIDRQADGSYLAPGRGEATCNTSDGTVHGSIRVIPVGPNNNAGVEGTPGVGSDQGTNSTLTVHTRNSGSSPVGGTNCFRVTFIADWMPGNPQTPFDEAQRWECG